MRFILILFTCFAVVACSKNEQLEKHPEFKSYFDEYKVDGCFLLYDFEKNKTIIFNQTRCSQLFLPASTFKIPHTLIGLETGIITDETFIIPWDSVYRQVSSWNKEHNLKSAFQNSVVPWYQELARRIGTQKMQYWVGKTDFGKMHINKDNIDLFWLSGKSGISPFEQLEFQKRLIKNELPFSKTNIELVKNLMILDRTPAYILRGKTGWAVMNNINIGWLVGYLEMDSKKYAYVINLESGDENIALFSESRKEITIKILKHLSLL